MAQKDPKVLTQPTLEREVGASRRFRVAVLLDNIDSDYQAEIIEGALRAARPAAVRTLIVPGGRVGEAGRNFLFEHVRQAQVDGILMLGGSLSNDCGLPHFREWARRFEPTPCVAIGVELSELPTVHVDNAMGMTALVQHLIVEHNRRRIAFIGGPAQSAEAEVRRRAYLQALQDHGVAPDERLMVGGNFTRAGGVEAVRRLFDDRHFSPDTLNAIVAVNDDSALGALEALTQRGISVPDQVSLTGFDNVESADAANPPLTTVDQRVEAQGYAGMRALIDALESGRAPESAVLDLGTVLRASCGCKRHTHNKTEGTVSPRLVLARSLRLALVERRGAIAAELNRVAAGRIAGIPNWESKLLNALERSMLAPESQTFSDEVERFVRRQLALRQGPGACHDVLTALRIHVVALTAAEPEIRPRVEDLFHESRLTIARAAADSERDHQRTLERRMRAITISCLSLIGETETGDLARVLDEHLPALGIATYIVSRFRARDRLEELEIVARRGSLQQSSAQPFVRAADLGLNAMFEQEQATVIQPLDHQGQPVGIAGLAWGAKKPVHYEQLREILAAALWSSRLAG
ncbi:MAG: substrate-binding domain-containing protein [Polyangiaceae bacterium]